MKFGVREICDVVLKAKAVQKVGDKVFYKDEPVLYFDSLKTSSLEGAATTVYAQGGRGNSRLIAWEGERTVTFTMEDALISPAGFSILSGAGLTKGKVAVHTTERTDKIVLTPASAAANADITKVELYVTNQPKATKATADEADLSAIYIMRVYNDEIVSEPYIPTAVSMVAEASGTYKGLYKITIAQDTGKVDPDASPAGNYQNNLNSFKGKEPVALVDYYTEKASVQQIDITPDKFGGNYYLEASTLFRDTNGVDLPAEFIIPNCKIQSNFTFSMASSGDPSTFTFTMDAFPDYTRWDPTKKVLASIQIIDAASSDSLITRTATVWTEGENKGDASREKTWTGFEPAND